VCKLIGIVFQDNALDDRLTVFKNLTVRVGLYGLGGTQLKSAVGRVIKMTNIEELANRPYKKLSGGQRRRVDTARALVNNQNCSFSTSPPPISTPKSAWICGAVACKKRA